MFDSLSISTSALTAIRTNLDVIAGNVANAFTTRGADGGAYRRRVVMYAEGDLSRGRGAPGVHVRSITQDPSPLRLEHDPSHPDAIKQGPHKGYVRKPNVDLSTEMVNAITAVRAYEANVTVMEITKSMAAASLRLIG